MGRNKMLNTKQVAEKTGFSVNHVRYLISTGCIKSKKLYVRGCPQHFVSEDSIKNVKRKRMVRPAVKKTKVKRKTKK